MNASAVLPGPLEIAGYLALWPALYLWGVGCLIGDAAGLGRPTALASTMLISLALSVYLVDRVKLADRFRDPADADTHAARDAWLWPRRRPVRALAAAGFLVATVVGFLVHPALALAPLVGQAGVFAYSGRPPGARARRLKDLLVWKNFAAAAALTVVAAVTVALPIDPRALPVNAAVMALLLVLADCILCDVADEHGDRRHGTVTVPVLFGPGRGRVLASILAALAALWVWLEGGRSPAAWALGIAASQAVLGGMGAGILRNATDLRLPILAAAVWLTGSA